MNPMNQELHNLIESFNADETEALLYFARKLAAGKAKHGPLDLNSDTRDFVREGLEERLDLAFYGVFDAMKRERAAQARSVFPDAGEYVDAPR